MARKPREVHIRSSWQMPAPDDAMAICGATGKYADMVWSAHLTPEQNPEPLLFCGACVYEDHGRKESYIRSLTEDKEFLQEAGKAGEAMAGLETTMRARGLTPDDVIGLIGGITGDSLRRVYDKEQLARAFRKAEQGAHARELEEDAGRDHLHER